MRRVVTDLASLMANLPQVGRLEWIGLRPARREVLDTPGTAIADPALGLQGDRYAGRSGTRQVTLVQQEHLAAIGSLLGGEPVAPERLRRNLVVSGLNLLALKGRMFTIGSVQLEYTGLCHPCSFMETTLGSGGYNAVRGHGGITARVLVGGVIEIGDAVAAV